MRSSMWSDHKMDHVKTLTCWQLTKSQDLLQSEPKLSHEVHQWKQSLPFHHGHSSKVTSNIEIKVCLYIPQWFMLITRQFLYPQQKQTGIRPTSIPHTLCWDQQNKTTRIHLQLPANEKPPGFPFYGPLNVSDLLRPIFVLLTSHVFPSAHLNSELKLRRRTVRCAASVNFARTQKPCLWTAFKIRVGKREHFWHLNPNYSYFWPFLPSFTQSKHVKILTFLPQYRN